MPSSLIGDIRTLAPRVPVGTGSDVFVLERSFAAILEREAELSWAPGDEGVGVTLGGEGAAFCADVVGYLCRTGLHPEHCAAVRKLWERFPETGVLLKADFSPRGLSSTSIYFQHPVSFREAGVNSKIVGSGPLPVNEVRELGKLLGRKSTFIGVEFQHGKEFTVGEESTHPGLEATPLPPLLSLYFPHLYRKVGATFLPAVMAAMARLGISGAQIKDFTAIHALLIPHLDRSVLISVAFQERFQELIKIDFDTIPLAAVAATARQLRVSADHRRRLEQLGEELETETVTYLGVKLGGKRARLKCYFKRYYIDEPEALVTKLLESSHWIT